MRIAWSIQRHSRDQVERSARLGGKGLWKKYYENADFKKKLDDKLRESRSRGGKKALWNLGESGFKRRLETAQASCRTRLTDSRGNRLRSSLELQIAELLIRSKIDFFVERRVEADGHAFYPDFSLKRAPKIIEVMGYAGDKYWNHTALKLKLITEAYPSIHVAVITTYLRVVKMKLAGIQRVTIFSPYQEAEITRWCRDLPG